MGKKIKRTDVGGDENLTNESTVWFIALDFSSHFNNCTKKIPSVRSVSTAGLAL